MLCFSDGLWKTFQNMHQPNFTLTMFCPESRRRRLWLWNLLLIGWGEWRMKYIICTTLPYLWFTFFLTLQLKIWLSLLCDSCRRPHLGEWGLLLLFLLTVMLFQIWQCSSRNQQVEMSGQLSCSEISSSYRTDGWFTSIEDEKPNWWYKSLYVSHISD